MLRSARLAVLAGLLAAIAVRAEPLDEILATGAASAEAGRGAQADAERVDDDTRALAAEYATLRRQLDGLAVYNARLERQIEDQQQRLAEIATASEDATRLAREIVPLIERMIDALESFVALDRPFRLDERNARIARLRADLARTDVPVAASFRAVLDAYRSELDYAVALGASSERIDHGGAERTMTLLQVGHLALFAQSEDGATTLWWSPATHAWELLEGADYARSIADGIRMARGEQAPALLRVPLAAPEATAR